MDAVRVEPGQSLVDISLQRCGSVEALLELAQTNGVSPTDTLTAGAALATPAPSSRAVANLYAVNGIIPATAVTLAQELQTIADEGIEFWAIEDDFIIS